jgi:hypothetical protein
MNEPTIICPNCKIEIKLTDSLAAPIIESTRQQYEQKIVQKDAEIGKREAAVRDQQMVLAKARESIDEQVAEKGDEQVAADDLQVVHGSLVSRL